MPTITGLSRLGEKAVQERMLDSAERSLYSQFTKELARVYGRIARDGRIDGDTMLSHQENVGRILATSYANIFNQFGMRILMGKKSHAEFENKADVPKTPEFDEARRKWIELFGADKVTQITGTTEEQAQDIINKAISQAVTDGLGERETAELIREMFADKAPNLTRLRSRVIARTEAHTASQAANQTAAEVSEIPMAKVWAASSGERTRDDHRRADNQKVGLNESFIVGGERLRYCGDPNGSAEQTINCRCITLYEPE